MNLEEMKKEVKRLELQNKLKKLGGSIESATGKKASKPENTQARMTREIKQLESSRKSSKGIGGWFRNLPRNLAINREINMRRQVLRVPFAAASAAVARSQLEEAKIRSEIAEMKKKNMVTFDSLQKGVKI